VCVILKLNMECVFNLCWLYVPLISFGCNQRDAGPDRDLEICVEANRI